MGRKAIPNAEEKILREVIALSRVHSIKKISTVDIAYRVRVSETVIFNRFPTKGELLSEAFCYSFKRMGNINYTTLLSGTETKELKFEEFKKTSDFFSDNLLEANYITAYLLSEYFNLADLERVDGIDLMTIRNSYPKMGDAEFLIFIKQYLVSLVAYANAKATGNKSDDFAFLLMPEVRE